MIVIFFQELRSPTMFDLTLLYFMLNTKALEKEKSFKNIGEMRKMLRWSWRLIFLHKFEKIVFIGTSYILRIIVRPFTKLLGEEEGSVPNIEWVRRIIHAAYRYIYIWYWDIIFLLVCAYTIKIKEISPWDKIWSNL